MVDAIGFRVISGGKLPASLPKQAPPAKHDESQVRFEGSTGSSKIGRRFMWMALLTSILSLGGSSGHKPVKADNLSILDSITGPVAPTPGSEKPVTETQKSPTAMPELSWLDKKGPTREMDVATLLQIAEKKSKAMEAKLKLAEVQASKERTKLVTDAKTKLDKALEEAQAAYKKEANSDDTTLKAKALYEACVVDPSLRKTKETWAPNTVRWAACDQSQGAGFHKIIDPLMDVLENPKTPDLYQALTAVGRIPALATSSSSSSPTMTVASSTLPPPRVVLDVMGPPAPARMTLTGLTGMTGGTGSTSTLGLDSLLSPRPERVRPPRDRFLELIRPSDFSWNNSIDDNPFAFPPRRNRTTRPALLLAPPTVTEERPLTITGLGGATLTSAPPRPTIATGSMAELNALFALTPDLAPMTQALTDPRTTALTNAMMPSVGPWGMSWGSLMGGGDGRPQVRLTSPNVGDLKGSWVKTNNKAMVGKRKVMIVYHSQEAFKPEVIIFIKKMSQVYGLSIGTHKPEDIDKLVRGEKSADFGDFILICPKGATAQKDISAGFDRMQAFAKATPGAEGFVYVDAHGSQRGAEAGLEDLDMLEGATKGITHFPDGAEIEKPFWMTESHKLKGFKGAVPFIIDTCHSASNLVQLPNIATQMPADMKTV